MSLLLTVFPAHSISCYRHCWAGDDVSWWWEEASPGQDFCSCSASKERFLSDAERVQGTHSSCDWALAAVSLCWLVLCDASSAARVLLMTLGPCPSPAEGSTCLPWTAQGQRETTSSKGLICIGQPRHPLQAPHGTKSHRQPCTASTTGLDQPKLCPDPIGHQHYASYRFFFFCA